jgi:glycosyltransferase involved in cell wall biosynthesis
MKSVAIISSQAFSLVNFRGPLIRDLVALNVRVYALAPDYNDQLRKNVENLGARPIDFCLVRAGMNPISDVIDTLRLGALLRRLRPDVTLGYFIKPVIYGTLAAWMARVPRRIAMIEGLGYVFTPVGTALSFRRKILRSAISWLYRVALRRAHRVIFLNRDDIAEFVEDGLVDKAQVAHLQGIGVDLHEWSPAPPFTKPLTFLLAARLLREKGIVEYAEAARQVKDLNPAVRFVLLGATDQNPGGLNELQVAAWIKEGLFEWPGHVEVKPWLALASVYVLPSYREGLPRSTQEAMAMGRPIITTDVPGCRETVEQGLNGFMVPARDAVALAQAMLIFVKHPELIAPMGAASRRMAEEKFDVLKINAEILKIMEL